MRPRSTLLVASSCAWLMLASTLLADSTPLSAIPENALGVAVIRNLTTANEAVTKVTRKMQIPAPNLLMLAKSFAGVDKGLDENGSIAAALMPELDDEAGLGVLVVVPVSDYKVFLEALHPANNDATIAEVKVAGQEAVVANKGSYAVFTSADKRKLLEQALASSKSVEASLEPLAKWANDQQLYVATTPAGKSRLLKTIIDLLPESAPDDADEDTKEQLKTAFEMTRNFRQLLAAADEQVTHIAIGARIEENSTIRLNGRVAFVPDGSLSNWAKQVATPSGAILQGLPEGKYALAYGGVSPQFNAEFTRLLERFTETGTQQLGLSEEARKKMATAALRQRSGVERTAGVVGVARPGESLMAGVISVERVKDSAAYLDAAREVFSTLKSGAKNDADDPLFAMEEIQIGDIKAIELMTDLTAIAAANNANNAAKGIMEGFFAKMFGADGKLRAYYAAADANHVVTTYNKDQLSRAIAHLRSGKPGLEADDAIGNTGKLLTAGSQWAAYVSPQGLLATIDSLLQSFLPPGSNFRIPEFPASDPIGLGAKISGTGLDGELVMPESVVAAIGRYVIQVQGLLQGGQAPLP
ncbi:MAG TPA: hypothetical protein VL175_19320 [Pirellulales bacterium]|nr:hypothetical protein [Pirellulales bacterium]